MGCPPGAERSKSQTLRAGRHRTWRTCGLPVVARKRQDGQDFDKPRAARRRGPRVHLDPWRPARPRCFFEDDAEMEMRHTSGRSKNRGGGALA